MDFLYLIFYGCVRLRFLDVETNADPRRPVPVVCRILCSNVLGLAGNLSDLTVASSQYDILLCSETLVSDMRLSCCIAARSVRIAARSVVSRQDLVCPCLVVSRQDASDPWDGCIRSRWLRSISPIQI